MQPRTITTADGQNKSIEDLATLEGEAAIQWLGKCTITNLNTIISWLKRDLLDLKTNDFSYNPRIKLESKYNPRFGSTPEQFQLQKKILGVLHVIDEIKKSNDSLSGEAKRQGLIQIAAFLSATKNCISDVIGFEMPGQGNEDISEKISDSDAILEINNRVKQYLHSIQAQRNHVQSAWRKITKPIEQLCKVLTSGFKSPLTSIGLFKTQRKSNYSTWRDAKDKANSLANLLKNVRP